MYQKSGFFTEHYTLKNLLHCIYDDNYYTTSNTMQNIIMCITEQIWA